MQCTNRFIRVAVVAVGMVFALLASIMPAHAAGPAGNASQAERKQCIGGTYDFAFWDLRGPGGGNRDDIGHVAIGIRESPSRDGDVRICAFTKHGPRTYGKPLFTSIRVGTVKKSGGARSLRYYDEGTFSKYTDGRAITPSAGRCVVVDGRIIFKKKVYRLNRVTTGCN